MSKLSSTIIKEIKEKDIKPIPKWQFVLLHVGMWALFGFALLFGSLATGIILFHLATTDWEVVPRIAGGLHSFIYVLPYIWILVVGLMIFLATKIYKHTTKGYRVRPSIIVTIAIIASLIMGSILFATRFAQGMDRLLREKVQPYRHYQELREKVWQAPEQGLLPGKIVKMDDNSLWIIDDYTGKKWTVDVTDAIFPPLAPPRIGDHVVIVGEKTAPLTFDAEGVRPAPHVLKGFKQKIQKMK
ncbi:hypothetical protein GF369_02755 [Candidatus Peregrinibacteria bacterium]|nr:hypothetical protein [Candidatus Peregrinibacteria bacterium]